MTHLTHEFLREIDDQDLDLLEQQARGLPSRKGQVPRTWQIERDYLETLEKGAHHE